MFPKPVGARPVTVTLTGVALQEIVPADSGYINGVLQLNMHERDNAAVEFYIYDGSTLRFDMTIGASGTIVWDQPEVPVQYTTVGSGLFMALSGPGEVRVHAKYIKYDRRTPVNLNPATYVAQVTRTPNCRGEQ